MSQDKGLTLKNQKLSWFIPLLKNGEKHFHLPQNHTIIIMCLVGV